MGEVERRRRGRGGREGVWGGIYNGPFQVQICIGGLSLQSEEEALLGLADDLDAN